MTDDNDKIKRFLESIPDKFQILEEGINIEVQKEYLEYSDGFERGQLTVEEIPDMEEIKEIIKIVREG